MLGDRMEVAVVEIDAEVSDCQPRLGERPEMLAMGRADPAVGDDQGALHVVARHVLGDAADVCSAGGRAFAGLQFRCV